MFAIQIPTVHIFFCFLTFGGHKTVAFRGLSVSLEEAVMIVLNTLGRHANL